MKKLFIRGGLVLGNVVCLAVFNLVMFKVYAGGGISLLSAVLGGGVFLIGNGVFIGNIVFIGNPLYFAYLDWKKGKNVPHFTQNEEIVQ